MTILLVGQAPGRAGRGKKPFDGRGGDRLARLAGFVDRRSFLRACRAVNLLHRWPGKAGKGDAFPRVPARLAARRLTWEPRTVVLLAGHAVAAAFDVADAPYFSWFFLRGGRAAVIPHPSGVSTWWNDARNVAAAGTFLRSVFWGRRVLRRPPSVGGLA